MQEVAPLPEELVGHVLGGVYQIESQLDEGGMGMVYRARHLRLGRPLAVKIMSAHLTQQPAALERFTREAEIISQLSHPHIVQVLDFNSTEDGRPYLVMELLNGRPLDALMAQHGRLQLTAALEIAIQSARALAVAHQAGIVHRDLKPANIFLIDAGEQLFVKLLDFGISKRTHGQAPGARKLTGEFDILGTPDYMAPEQAVGKTSQVDHRGDQYALATILYEMLVGHVPFKADEILELLQKVIQEPPTSPSSFRPDIPAEVDQAILRALSKSPSERFPTVLDFAEILELARDEARLKSPHFGRPALQRYDRSAASLAPTSAPAPRSRPDGRDATAPAFFAPPPPADLGAPTPPPDIVSPLGKVSWSPPPQPTAPPAMVTHSTAPHSTAPHSTPPHAAGAHASERPGSRPSRPTPARTSWHAHNPVEAATELLDRARQELGLDNLSVAVSCAESALEIARTTESREAKDLIAGQGRLLQRIFERRLASIGRRITLSDEPFAAVELSPEEAFLLSRLDNGMTIEEAVDLSPLSREQTLGGLVGLVTAGQISLQG